MRVHPLHNEADALWVRRCLSGSPTDARFAYGELVKTHETGVLSLLKSLCRDPQKAEDLAQDTFVKGWQKLASITQPSRFGSWIRSLAYREFLHAHRRAKLEARFVTDVTLEVVGDAEKEDGGSDAAISHELAEILALVDSDEAELLLLSYGFGFTIAEIASARNVPAGTIKSLLHRAKRKIQTHLSREDFPERRKA